MTRCWNCGTEREGQRFLSKCPICSQSKEVKKIREVLESYQSKDIHVEIDILEVDFTELSYQLSEIASAIEWGFKGIASVIEWGFEELSWKVGQMIGVLKSIDETLKIPSQTQANEWRQIAEELRQRGVLNESERFFLMSLESNPLDYRTYIGLGKTYLHLEKPEEAKAFWEKSLPHAPKGEIDYKSYSYRLIGRIYFCQENYQKAVLTLEEAIELSPNYYFGHYDYAQYCALIGNKENFFSSLRIALAGGLIPLELVKKERNFDFFRKETTNLLRDREILLAELKTSSYVIWKGLVSRLGVFEHDQIVVTLYEAVRRVRAIVEGIAEDISNMGTPFSPSTKEITLRSGILKNFNTAKELARSIRQLEKGLIQDRLNQIHRKLDHFFSLTSSIKKHFQHLNKVYGGYKAGEINRWFVLVSPKEELDKNQEN